MALTYMDVGEGREPGAEALPAHAALQQHAPENCRAAIELVRGSLGGFLFSTTPHTPLAAYEQLPSSY